MILNRCHRFRIFVYQHTRFSVEKKNIEVAVRPPKGSAAVCALSSFPWGLLAFHLYSMRRVDCRRCGFVAVEEVPWAMANAH